MADWEQGGLRFILVWIDRAGRTTRPQIPIRTFRMRAFKMTTYRLTSREEGSETLEMFWRGIATDILY
jgi:hypothetical protein